MLEIVKMYVQRIKVGRPTDLNSDEEELVVALAEIKVLMEFPLMLIH